MLSSQLCNNASPGFSVFVADFGNNRVQKWRPKTDKE